MKSEEFSFLLRVVRPEGVEADRAIDFATTAQDEGINAAMEAFPDFAELADKTTVPMVLYAPQELKGWAILTTDSKGKVIKARFRALKRHADEDAAEFSRLAKERGKSWSFAVVRIEQ